jgi:hypothetical protein
MQSVTLFQCIPSYKPLPTVRLIKSLAAGNCKILLDLEDSIQDVQNPELTPRLKVNARQDFAGIVRNLPDLKISVRINSVRSTEFEKDKEILRQFDNNIESVFIPKVENRSDLEIVSNEFPSGYKMNLIIETQRGIDNMDEILSSDLKENIDYVFFGNYDYHLDTNTFPVTEQYNPDYWKIVEPVISGVERHKMNFGNSPYANVADTNCLDHILMQLTQLCKRNFALMSLHKIQTSHFQNLIKEWNLDQSISERNNKDDFSLDTFTINKQKGRSFAFDSKKRIITPQEYLLLLKRQNG